MLKSKKFRKMEKEVKDFLTKRQILLLRYAKEKGIIYLADAQKFYTSRPIEQLLRLKNLGYFETIPFGKFKYTGKPFEIKDE